MPAVEKQVRAFISSTFRDMHAERGHLVHFVFSRLDAWDDSRMSRPFPRAGGESFERSVLRC
jgi:hypothetical protein